MRKWLGIAAVAVGLAGCGGTKVITQTNTVIKTTTQTKTVHEVKIKVKHGPPPPAKTVTDTVTVRALPEPTSSFSGNGGENLGTIHIASDSEIVWTDDGGLFNFTDSGTGIFVNSQAPSGTSFVAAGTYTGVTVNAAGNWTIKILPKG
jgi:hypothetical protein